MTGLEAWKIISANMVNLYKLRGSVNGTNRKCYSDEEIQAEVICFAALKEFDERNKNDNTYL